MKKHLASIITYLFFFFWFACLTSQSLMDLADTLMFLTGTTILVLKARSAKDWKMLWPDTTGLGWLWLAWFVVVLSGMFYINGVHSGTISALLEFRWMIIFQILCFTLSWVDWDDKKMYVIMSILLFMVIICFGIWIFAEDQRAGGTFEHSMPFAHTYGPAFFIMAGVLIMGVGHQPKWRWLSITVTIATLVITAMSLARGVWIGMAIGLLVISLLGSKKPGLALVALLGCVFAITLSMSSVAREKTLTTNSVANESDNQRKALWLGNWEIIKDYPIFGAGYSQNKNYLRHYYDKLGLPPNQFISHAHNQYLHFWAGTGTTGLICFIVFIIAIGRMTLIAFLKIEKDKFILRGLLLGSLGAQICFHLSALTESNFSIAKNRYMLLLVSAISVSIYYRYVAKKDFKLYEKLEPKIN